MSQESEAAESDGVGATAVELDGQDDLVLVVRDLTKEFTKLNQKIPSLEETTRTSQRWIRWLIISLILHVPVTIGLGVLAILAINSADNATQAVHTSQVALYRSCQNSNDYRAADLKRWNTIIALTTVPGRLLTPAQQHEVDSINQTNQTTDAQRKCIRPSQ